jgi:hypothetical protein
MCLHIPFIEYAPPSLKVDAVHTRAGFLQLPSNKILTVRLDDHRDFGGRAGKEALFERAREAPRSHTCVFRA